MLFFVFFFQIMLCKAAETVSPYINLDLVISTVVGLNDDFENRIYNRYRFRVLATSGWLTFFGAVKIEFYFQRFLVNYRVL